MQKATKTNFLTKRRHADGLVPGLRLVTCGGPFDTQTRQYLDRIVVSAHLVKSPR